MVHVSPYCFRYLSGKIKEGEAHNITCPGFDCIKLVPVEIIETLVSRDMSRRYLQFDIKVSSVPFISIFVNSYASAMALFKCYWNALLNDIFLF